MKIKIGNIYNLIHSNQTIKVIGVDDYEILYDFFWSHNNSWAFSSNLKKKGFFYRMNKDKFLQSVEKIKYEELSLDQINILRPDLPIRIGRVAGISWRNNVFNSKDVFEKTTKIDYDSTINCNKIWLYPLSLNNKPLKPKLIEAKSKKLTLGEILLCASEIRKTSNNEDSNGIGIYRLGINKKSPSYYIGEYVDLMGNGTE